VLNSVAVAAFVPSDSTVVDVGSGAGLPGIPLAIARPDLRVTLLEPLLRRATFLSQAAEELGLGGRVTVVRGRAEEQTSTYDVATCRAVAPLERLLGWCAPLFLPFGQLLALKGSSAAAEVSEAASVLRTRRLRAEVLEADTDARVVRVRAA
jgi:16S rRNA (guanine527-N7)-methyltransferase